MLYYLSVIDKIANSTAIKGMWSLTRYLVNEPKKL
jgi:hypothetical protein